jgi:chemotaxis protein CheC
MPSIAEEQLDALQEFINIGVGRAAGMLNEMVEAPIQLSVPVLTVLDRETLRQQLTDRLNDRQLSVVRLSFAGDFSGSAELLFPTESAAALVSILTGENKDSPDLDEVKIGALTEVGNIVINGVMGSISNLLRQQMNYSIPTYYENTIEKLLSSNSLFDCNTIFLLAQAKFEIKQLEILGKLILIFEMTSFSELLNCIDREIYNISRPSEMEVV